MDPFTRADGSKGKKYPQKNFSRVRNAKKAQKKVIDGNGGSEK